MFDLTIMFRIFLVLINHELLNGSTQLFNNGPLIWFFQDIS